MPPWAEKPTPLGGGEVTFYNARGKAALLEQMFAKGKNSVRSHVE
jgi:hypothetical protein